MPKPFTNVSGMRRRTGASRLSQNVGAGRRCMLVMPARFLCRKGRDINQKRLRGEACLEAHIQCRPAWAVKGGGEFADHDILAGQMAPKTKVQHTLASEHRGRLAELNQGASSGATTLEGRILR